MRIQTSAFISVLFIIFCSCNREKDFTIINLQAELPIPSEHKIPCNIQITEHGETDKYSAKIKRRGGFSMQYPKHSYSISFKNSISFGNLPAQKSWIMNANFIDKTFLRHKLNYDLFRKMNLQNKSPQSEFAELFINGKYNGLYVIMEKMDEFRLFSFIDENEAVIFKDCPIFHFEKLKQVQDSMNYYQQEFPDHDKTDKSYLMDSLWNFLHQSNDSVFASKVSEVFDLRNILDWHLLLLFSNNGDGILKNFFLFRENNHSKYQVALWDYDHSFGRDGDGSAHFEMDTINIYRSILFNRLMNLNVNGYQAQLKNRWQELRMNGIFTEKAIFSMIDSDVSEIKNHIEKNAVLYPDSISYYKDANSFIQEIDLMKSYISRRLIYLDEYFASKPY